MFLTTAGNQKAIFTMDFLGAYKEMFGTFYPNYLRKQKQKVTFQQFYFFPHNIIIYCLTNLNGLLFFMFLNVMAAELRMSSLTSSLRACWYPLLQTFLLMFEIKVLFLKLVKIRFCFENSRSTFAVSTDAVMYISANFAEIGIMSVQGQVLL